MEAHQMVRYTINVTPPGSTPLSVLVPLPPSATVSALGEEIIARLARRGLDTSLHGHDVILHLGGSDGPVLDAQDTISDVIVDPGSKTIHASLQDNAHLGDRAKHGNVSLHTGPSGTGIMF